MGTDKTRQHNDDAGFLLLLTNDEIVQNDRSKSLRSGFYQDCCQLMLVVVYLRFFEIEFVIYQAAAAFGTQSSAIIILLGVLTAAACLRGIPIIQLS